MVSKKIVFSAAAALIMAAGLLLALMYLDHKRDRAMRRVGEPPFGYTWSVSADIASYQRILDQIEQLKQGMITSGANLVACPAILDLDWRDPFIRQARLVITAGFYGPNAPEKFVLLYDGPVADSIILRVPAGVPLSGVPAVQAVLKDSLRHESWATKTTYDFACDGRPLRIRLHGPAVRSPSQPEAIEIVRQ
jgi:hypothetical protein